MATCPDCGASSRTSGGFEVTKVLIFKPLGTWSLAGQQMKASAVEWLKLSHDCGWSIYGWLEDGTFIAPSVQPSEE